MQEKSNPVVFVLFTEVREAYFKLFCLGGFDSFFKKKIFFFFEELHLCF